MSLTVIPITVLYLRRKSVGTTFSHSKRIGLFDARRMVLTKFGCALMGLMMIVQVKGLNLQNTVMLNQKRILTL